MKDKNRVVKIRPSWEAVSDEDGKIVLDFSNIPQGMVDHNQRISDKIKRQLENKSKL